MKKLIFCIAAALLCMACNDARQVNVMVENPLGVDRDNEMVEVSMNDVAAKLGLADTAQIVVLDESGCQVQYQITYDEKVIFPVSVGACSSAVYTIVEGEPEVFSTRVFGRCFPERMDDVAWENDLTAYRTYGPASERSGARTFGYDIWTKYNTDDLVLEERYANEVNPQIWARIADMKANDPAAAEDLYRSVSYHVDHGNGMDCYSSGATLGGGTAALMVADSIIYPYCYATQEVLDIGPLRFTVQLSYNPLVVEADSGVVEKRIISLDAYSHFNKTVVSYSNLSKVQTVATGIVLHEPDGNVVANAEKGYILYVDPTDNPYNDNGLIFVGAVFPDKVDEAKPVLFSARERDELRGGAYGHVLAVSEYEPGSDFTYYWGSAWSKADIKSAESWHKYVADFAGRVRNPLIVTVK